MTSLGQRLREERKKMELSQSEFARALGIHLNTQSRYEKGEREPDSNYLNSLMDFGVDVTYVLTGERRNEKGTGTDDFTLTAFGEAVAKLTHTQRSELQRLVHTASAMQDKRENNTQSPDKALAQLEETLLLLIAEFFRERRICLTPDEPRVAASQQADIDSTLLCQVIQAIYSTAEVLEVEPLKPSKIAQAASLLYRSASSSGEIDPSFVEDVVKLCS